MGAGALNTPNPGSTSYPFRISGPAGYQFNGTLLGYVTGFNTSSIFNPHLSETTLPPANVTLIAPGGGPNGLKTGTVKPSDTQAGGAESDCRGMMTYTSHLMQASLALADRPLSYEAPFGPALDFSISYSQADERQSSGWPQSHFGPKWTCNWFAWIDEQSGTSLILAQRGGGSETYLYDGATQSYTAGTRGGAVVRALGGGGFERTFSDGSVEVYQTTSPGIPNRFFLTKVRDPQANEVVLGYGSDGISIRQESITDAATTVSKIS